MATITNDQSSVPPQSAPPGKGKAVAAFVLGLLAIFGCAIPAVNVGSIVLAVVALVLGVLALRAVAKRRAGGKGLAIAGLVLAVAAIVIAIIVNVLAAIAIKGVSDSVEKDRAADAAAAEQFPGATADDVVGEAGSALAVGDVSVTTTPLAPQSNDFGSYLCSTATYVNNGDAGASFNTFDWSLQDPAGAARTVGIFGDNDLSSGELAPGGTVTGDVCFEGDAATPGQYVLLYAGDLFGTQRGAWLNSF